MKVEENNSLLQKKRSKNHMVLHGGSGEQESTNVSNAIFEVDLHRNIGVISDCFDILNFQLHD